jgi:hypothetical protein
MSRTFWNCLLVTAAVLAVSMVGLAQGIPCSNINLGLGGNLHQFVPFGPSNLWNKNIADAPVDNNSVFIINFIGAGTRLHPDFGQGLWDGSTMGIPYIVVPGNQPLVNINFTAYGDESDPGPMPIPASAPIQGYPNPGDNDRHVIVLDKGNCWAYELYHAYKQSDGSWNADSAAVWDLTANHGRPYTWTSVNAGGTAEFPGLARQDEVASGVIRHALAFTVRWSREAFTPPASHWAPNTSNLLAAPMGMRLRLKANFDISGYPPDDQVILTALKQYGMIVVDNGGSMFLSGTPDIHWNDNHLNLLKNVVAGNFEVVRMDPVYTRYNLPNGPYPVISSFSATHSAGRGQPVTLSWNVFYCEYYIVSPSVGAIRGTSTVVYPQQTTTYTLSATNQYGRTTTTVTVQVQ